MFTEPAASNCFSIIFWAEQRGLQNNGLKHKKDAIVRLHTRMQPCFNKKLTEFCSKTNKRNTTKNKFLRYLCLIVVDFIHGCHHRLKMSGFRLKKNKFRSIDLTCWRSTQPLRLLFLNSLNASSLKTSWSKGDSSHFENSPSFQISWTSSDVFRINKKFIQQLSAMFTYWDGKGGELCDQASKVPYSPHGAVNIVSHKESLNQSDCWKFFV